MAKTTAIRRRQIDPTPAKQENARMITSDAIALRAYALYQSRHGEDGHDVEDWLQAERELLQEQLSANETTVVY